MKQTVKVGRLGATYCWRLGRLHHHAEHASGILGLQWRHYADRFIVDDMTQARIVASKRSITDLPREQPWRDSHWSSDMEKNLNAIGFDSHCNDRLYIAKNQNRLSQQQYEQQREQRRMEAQMRFENHFQNNQKVPETRKRFLMQDPSEHQKRQEAIIEINRLRWQSRPEARREINTSGITYRPDPKKHRVIAELMRSQFLERERVRSQSEDSKKLMSVEEEDQTQDFGLQTRLTDLMDFMEYKNNPEVAEEDRLRGRREDRDWMVRGEREDGDFRVVGQREDPEWKDRNWRVRGYPRRSQSLDSGLQRLEDKRHRSLPPIYDPNQHSTSSQNKSMKELESQYWHSWYGGPSTRATETTVELKPHMRRKKAIQPPSYSRYGQRRGYHQLAPPIRGFKAQTIMLLRKRRPNGIERNYHKVARKQTEPQPLANTQPMPLPLRPIRKKQKKTKRNRKGQRKPVQPPRFKMTIKTRPSVVRKPTPVPSYSRRLNIPPEVVGPNFYMANLRNASVMEAWRTFAGKYGH